MLADGGQGERGWGVTNGNNMVSFNTLVPITKKAEHLSDVTN